MTTYNNVTENCFKDCIHDFTSRKILKQEVGGLMQLTEQRVRHLPFFIGANRFTVIVTTIEGSLMIVASSYSRPSLIGIVWDQCLFRLVNVNNGEQRIFK